MKKTTIILLGLIVFIAFSCQKKEERKGRTGSYIQEYVVNPEFKAVIIDCPLFYTNPSEKELIAVVLLTAPKDNGTSRVVHYYKDPEEFSIYAKRYGDLTYTGGHTAPNVEGALAEPINKIRCYEVSSTGNLTDVSDMMSIEALTYLPYIKSGYKDRDQIEPSTPRHRFSPRDYFVNKPLKALTTEDLTLLNYKQFDCLLELVPIAPYVFDKKTQLKIVIEENGQIHEVMANYTDGPF